MKVWAAALICCLAFGLYVNTLGHGFVFDDLSLISQNPRVEQFKWREMFSLSGYRPVRTFTYAVNYAVGGESPFGYHLVNVLLHAINAFLVYLLFWTWSGSNVLAGSGALLFAVHPVQTAAVAYVSGRKDLLATLFVLLGCYLYGSYRKRKRHYLAVLSFFSFLLGILCKEVAIVFGGLLIGFDVLLLPEIKGRPREGLLRMLRASPYVYGLLAVFIPLAGYYAIVLTQASRMEGFWGGELATNVGTSFKLLMHYLKLAVWPHPLIADYTGEVFPISQGFLELSTLLAVATAGGYVTLVGWAYRRSPRLAFALLWFLLALFPVLQIIPFHEVAADHFLYFPLVGVAFAGGLATDYLVRSRGAAILAWGLVGMTAGICAILTVSRNVDWKNEQSLWEATIRVAPGSYRANSNLGVLYHNQGKFEVAERLTKRSLELDPSRALSWSNLGSMYHDLAQRARMRGNFREAATLAKKGIENLEESVALNPSDPFAFGNLGSCYKELGLSWELQGKAEKSMEARKTAVRIFLKALKLKSDNELFPAIWFNLGMVFVEGGYYRFGVPYLKNFLQAYPDYGNLPFSSSK